MSTANAAEIIRAAVAGSTERSQTVPLARWDDLSKARHHIEHGVLEAAALLADSDPCLLLSVLASGEPSAVATIAAFLLSHGPETRARSWFAEASDPAIKELALAAWLRETATRYASDPDTSHLEIIAEFIDSHYRDASPDLWWRILELGPRLASIASQRSFLETLYAIAATRIANLGAVPSDADFAKYRRLNSGITSCLIYAMPSMEADTAAGAEDSFWRHLRIDVFGDALLGVETTGDLLYLDATSEAIHRCPTRWVAIASDALGIGRWKAVVSASREGKIAWLLAAASRAATLASPQKSMVSAVLREDIWTIASRCFDILFWDVVTECKVRLHLAFVLTSALAFDANTATPRIAQLANEVPTLLFLDAIASALPSSADASLQSCLAQLREERAAFERALYPDASDSALAVKRRFAQVLRIG